ncbi:MAG: AMP-binding protein, partial [Candidatus Eisenbacteria bacterium]
MIADILGESTQRFGERPCLRSFSEGRFSSLSYKELDRLATLVSSAIIAHGVEPLERVCIVSENRPEWVVGYLGALRCGCVAVPLDSLSKPEDIRYLVRRARARVVFCSARFAKDLEELGELGSLKPEMVCFDRVEGFRTLEELLVKGEKALREGGPSQRRVPEDSDAVLIFTSGTT